MLNGYGDDFDQGDEDSGNSTRFWNKEIDGKPLWYFASMAAVPLGVGLLISRLHYAQAVLPWVLGFMILGGMVMLWSSLRCGE